MKNLFLLLLFSIAFFSCEKPTSDPGPQKIDMSYRIPTEMTKWWYSSYESCLSKAMHYYDEERRIITPNTITVITGYSMNEYYIYNFTDNQLVSITFGWTYKSASLLDQLATGAIDIIEGYGKVDYYIYEESFVVAYYDYSDESKEYKQATTCHCYPKTKANLRAWGIQL